MAPRPGELLQGLHATGQERLTALKKVKNSIIGNKHRKEAFIKAGAIPQIIELLSTSESDPELQVQAAVTLGSLVCAGGLTDSDHQTQGHAGLEVALGVLVQAEELRVVEAAVRCVKMICQAAPVPSSSVLQPGVLSRLSDLLASPASPGVANGVACILMACCSTRAEQQALTEAGVLRGLVHQLPSWPGPSVHNALHLLALLLLPDVPASLQLLRDSPITLDHLTARLREESPLARALAASCIGHLASTMPLVSGSPRHSSQGTGPDSGGSGGGAGSSGAPLPAAARVGSVITRVFGQAARAAANPSSAFGGAPLFRLSSLPNSVDRDGTACGRLGQGEPGGSAGGSAAAAAGPKQRRWEATVDLSGGGDVAMSPTGSPAAPDVTEKLVAAQRLALPVVLRLLGEGGVAGELATATLAMLVEDNEDLQRTAVDADAPRLLCALLCQPPHKQQFTQQFAVRAGDIATPREGWLRALGALCMGHDDARKQMLEPKVLGAICAALEYPHSAGMRAAAALCVLALTRNIKALRCSPLLSCGVADSLCDLLRDEDKTVQVNVCAAVCNLVLEVAQVKDIVLETGGLEMLCTHTGSPEMPVRLYSSWALRNLCHKRPGGVKRAVMQALGWPRMRALLTDSSEGVQEQAVCMLRNLCMDAPDHISSAYEWGGADLLAALEEKLDPSRQVPSVLRVHALYTLVNSLTGSESTKELIMSSNVPALVCHHMRTSTEPEVRLPAVWCIINLTWASPSSGPTTTGGPASTGTTPHRVHFSLIPAPIALSTAPAPSPPPAPTPPAPAPAAAAAAAAAGGNSSMLDSRLRRLRALGCTESLQALLADTNPDVRERARQALELLRGSSSTSAFA